MPGLNLSLSSKPQFMSTVNLNIIHITLIMEKKYASITFLIYYLYALGIYMNIQTDGSRHNCITRREHWHTTIISNYLLGAPSRGLLAGNEAYQSGITTGAGGIKGNAKRTVTGGSCYDFPREALLLPKSL